MTRDRKIRRAAGVIASGLAVLSLAQMSDARARRGRRWRSQVPLWTAMLLGMVSGRKNLAGVERMTDDLPLPLRRKTGIRRRVPDTTMRDLVMATPLAGPRELLHRQVRRAHRRKALAPGLPCGVVAIDGKTVMTRLPDRTFAQDQGGERYAVRTMTSSLISARARVCLDAEPIPKEHNEVAWFLPTLLALRSAYAGLDLFELVTGDAGMTSKDNANAVHAMNLGYLFGLKGNQPELLAEAERLLAHLPADDALAETSERQNGRIVTRRLWLTAEMAGYHDWEHLRTVIRVQSESRYYDGRLDREIENRYFLTNEPYGRFRPAQWLAVIRGHWRVETDCHQTWDVAFEEDDHPWIRATHGLLVTQLLRRIGYNLLVLFRNVSLRSERKALLPWNELYEWLDLALKAALDHHVEGLRWEDRSAATRV